jgi:hypothetical protein
VADILICVVKYLYVQFFFVGAGIGFSCWTMILKCMEIFFRILFVHVFGFFSSSEFLSISLFS